MGCVPVTKDRKGAGTLDYCGPVDRRAPTTILFCRRNLASDVSDDVKVDLEQIISDPTTTTTEKIALIKSRIGQGTFRDRVLLHWTGCGVTGFSDTSILVASHIKPWKKSTNSERLDQRNGLLLSPNLDKAFDKSLITFEMGGLIRLSPLFTQAAKLGITPSMKIALKPEPLRQARGA